MVTIAAESEGTNDERIEKAFFIVEPNLKELTEISRLLDSLAAFAVNNSPELFKPPETTRPNHLRAFKAAAKTTNLN
jgi:hypothetical protein